MIELSDPRINHFYGNTFITKDLFFSRDTSTLFLRNVLNKTINHLLLFIAVLVLVQQIHYTIDVAFAFPFDYLCFITSGYLTLKKL